MVFAMMDIHLMIRGGAPIELNTLEPFQWKVLGIIREEREVLQWQMLSLKSLPLGPQAPPKT